MQQTQGIWEQRWVRLGVLPLVFYTVVTLILTYPLVTQLTTHAAGAAYGDAFESVRLIWWTREALAQGLHPAWQPLLLYPEGFFSAVQWAAPIAHLTGVPFALLFPPLVAYNLTFLLAFVLTGWASFWFFRELVGHEGAALLGGLIVLAFPTRMGHAAAGHLGLIFNVWRMLYLWALLRSVRGAGWRTGVFGGVMLGLTLGSAPTNIAYEVIPLTALVGGAFAWQQRAHWRAWRIPALVLFLMGAALALFFYLPLLRGVEDAGYLVETGVVRYSTDLLAFGLPSPFNPVMAALGLDSQVVWDVLGDNAIEGSAYLGLVAVGLAFLALRQERARAWPWLLLTGVSMILALGPVLKVADHVVQVAVGDGTTSSILLPYALYGSLPGLSMARTPARFGLLVSIGLAALAALGWTALSGRVARLARRGQVAGVGIAAALIVVEYVVFLPFPTTAAPQPAYYDELARQAAAGEIRPVLELPAGDFFTNLWLLYGQTAHHQPVIAGHVIRNTPANPALLALVNAAALPPDASDFMTPLTIEDQAGLLRASGAAVVVVRRAAGEGAAMAAYLPEVLGAPVYEDAEVTIFEVPDGPLPDRVLTVALDGWPVAEHESARWVGDGLRLAAFVPQAGRAYWTFEAGSWLVDRWVTLDYEEAASDAFYVEAGDAVQMWHASQQTLDTGFHMATFDVPAESSGCTLLPGEPGCREVWIGTPRLQFEEEDQQPGGVFGDKMRLVSWQVMGDEAGTLILDLNWQALAADRADYTAFVHLLDAEGNLVAQWDDSPGPDGQPTSVWPQNGARWQRVTLGVDVEPGSYQVYVGMYTHPDLVRLPVLADTPRAADGLYFLQEWTAPLVSVD